jgi:hypothetical protein
MDVRQKAQVCTAASVKTAMYRLLIRIFLESDLDDDLDAIVEREIELPFVPRRGLRIDFADDVEDGPVDLVLGKTVWRVAKNRFEFEMTERGENGGTVLALMDEWTQVGFTVVDCSNQQIWDGFRNGPPEANGHKG